MGNPVPDLYQVELRWDLLTVKKNAAAGFADVADGAIEGMASVGRDDYAPKQYPFAPLGAPLQD